MLDLFPLSALLALTALAGAQDPAQTAVTRAYGITPAAPLDVSIRTRRIPICCPMVRSTRKTWAMKISAIER